MKVRIAERLDQLLLDRHDVPPFDDPAELLFHRLKLSSPIFDLALSLKTIDQGYLGLRIPNISVTRGQGGLFEAHDALIRIDTSGYKGIVPDHGVIQMLVGNFQIDELVVQSDKEPKRVFQSSVEPVPYPANRAHAEIWLYKVGDKPSSGTGLPVNLPKSIKGAFRLEVLKRWRRFLKQQSGTHPWILIGRNNQLIFE